VSNLSKEGTIIHQVTEAPTFRFEVVVLIREAPLQLNRNVGIVLVMPVPKKDMPMLISRC
jgi:hypothetical protein